ncbi:acetoacetate--CoA ligase [Rhodococcus koreensis]|uniref:acetoacetate--CoA ligase n=1 Tax=Rhodococcus koreensis TaxID=99653 RepID=UPI00367051F7
MADGQVLWEPSRDRIAAAQITKFENWLAETKRLSFEDYGQLWQWSVDEPREFWGALAEFADISWRVPPRMVLGDSHMPGAEWFPGAKLNYAEHALRRSGDEPALIMVREDGAEQTLSFDELRDEVAACRAGLVKLGVQPGDRVAAVMPSCAAAVICFLATASIGAVWTLCSPDYGARAIADRFSQVEPKVLVAVNGYMYGGKQYDVTSTVAELDAALPSVNATIVVAYVDGSVGNPSLTWDELLSDRAPIEFEPVGFDHPLWILYSSGTTGLPKALVHGHGGVLLEHFKHLSLHDDLGPGSRFFWFTASGWVMWNLSLSALTVGACMVGYDGNPGYPNLNRLWETVDRLGVTFFGTSPAFMDSCARKGVSPGADFALESLATVGSTGSPLTAEGFEWIYDNVKKDVLVTSVSGGTDLASAFVGAVPTLPVRSGRIQIRMLGADVKSFDERGTELIDAVGELVLTQPLPSMPLCLWGDPDGTRLRESYYDMYPGVWRHGDWVRISSEGDIVILGRSDSTLNRGGVRMGTSEFYRVVEQLPGVVNSLVIDTSSGGDVNGKLLLFVVLEPGASVDDAFLANVRAVVREQLSPRHIPDAVIQVTGVPTTITGKKCEVPVKRILAGVPVAKAVDLQSLANPEVVDQYVRFEKTVSPV